MTTFSFLLLDLFLDDRLRCDGGMVGAGEPEGGESPHTLIANKNILNGKTERVAHMEYPGRVWRRHHDSEGLSLRTLRQVIWIKIAAFFPRGLDARLCRSRVIGLQEFLLHRL